MCPKLASSTVYSGTLFKPLATATSRYAITRSEGIQIIFQTPNQKFYPDRHTLLYRQLVTFRFSGLCLYFQSAKKSHILFVRVRRSELANWRARIRITFFSSRQWREKWRKCSALVTCVACCCLSCSRLAIMADRWLATSSMSFLIISCTRERTSYLGTMLNLTCNKSKHKKFVSAM